MADDVARFEGWVILEIMGHKRLAGYLTEQSIAGVGFLRIDVPREDEPITQFYAPSSVYCITPTTEDLAREVAQLAYEVGPVSRYEVKRLEAPQPIEERIPYNGMEDDGTRWTGQHDDSPAPIERLPF